MTGNRAFYCIFCRILRMIERNRRISHASALRFSPVAGCVNTKYTFSTSAWLRDSTKGSGTGSSSSDSSSDDDDLISSSGSESDSDREMGSNQAQSGKQNDLMSLLSRMNASEEKSGTKAQVEMKLKEIEHSIDSNLVTEAVKLSKGAAPNEKGSKSNDLRGNDQAESEKQNNLMSLLSRMKASEEKWGTKAEMKLKEIEHSIDANLVTEAVKLSKELPGDQVKSESALIGQLLTQFETTANQRKGAAPKEKGSKSNDLSAIIGGLSIDKEYKKHTQEKGQRMDFGDDFGDMEDRPFTYRSGGVGLFTGEPLGIFTKEDMKSAKPGKKTLFEIVEDEEKKDLEFYPPQNAFEEQIQWTKEGKLWTFPIDNEAGWESEKNVDYTQHVFLDDRLEGFPRKGPVRDFMEVVATALGKNPYLTIEQKHETIEWYRNYFKEREDVLEETLGEDGLIKALN